MTVSTAALFKPFTCRGLAMPNRVVMAPMTRNFSPNGVPGPDVAAYYRRRAEGGVGLIVTEGTAIDHAPAVDNPAVPHFFGEAALAGWAKVAEAVHSAGGRIMPQLWHVGMMRKPGSSPNPEAPSFGPSGRAMDGTEVSAPPSDAEIADVIAAYGKSAGHAKRLGFDGVELHGAHGYLIDQFFWSRTNTRGAPYGGDMVARTRFGAEVIKACRQGAGENLPVVLRWSQWKSVDYKAKLAATPQELEKFLGPLVDAGVDIFHCSQRRFWEPEFEGSPLNLGGWVKKLTGKPVTTVGSIGLDSDIMNSFQGKTANHVGIEQAVRMVEAGEVDLIAVGRAILADPAWAAKTRDGRAVDMQPFNVAALQALV